MNIFVSIITNKLFFNKELFKIFFRALLVPNLKGQSLFLDIKIKPASIVTHFVLHVKTYQMTTCGMIRILQLTKKHSYKKIILIME